MTRFRAYTTDSEDEDDGPLNIPTVHEPVQSPNGVHQEDENMSSDSETSDSDMLETELLISPVKQKKPQKAALVQGEDGDYYHAYETGRQETPTDVSTSDSESESEDEVSPQPINRSRKDTSIIPWAQHVGVEPQRMHVMQTSLFRMPEEATMLQQPNLPSRFQALPSNFNLNRKHSRDSDGEGLRLDLQQVWSYLLASFSFFIDFRSVHHSHMI
jgi:nuclear pore complex protein Nup98-Nup96